ncbi:protein MICROTUBULE BINDING PROTEIN 2C-like isoform X1 [Cucurbita maxima]|uniref:Protein MICROTUBULE BINDING PROTEIN 2C-like isoform X1 n=1 Tax=Cucurbita maxima TaxID=3661 RepID=A0A6J1KK98_CUCMA|nr:protein MICROTUBULE BINDING PROTEIN 2C-like isoform X1 [Cucurbita maxima]
MFEPQHFVDLQDDSAFGDQKSWNSGDHNASPTRRLTHSSLPIPPISASATTAAGANGNVDRELFNNLVAIVPLVQSLIDRKASSSFRKRGSMIYTKTPSRESLHRKMEQKGRHNGQSIPTKKKKDHGVKDQSNNVDSNSDADGFSVFSSSSLVSERDKEELITLREQVEDLRKKLLEKDELLKSAEMSKDQMNNVYAKLDALNLQSAEKDSRIKMIHSQLSDAKIKLADKQAALEKIQWEVMTSNSKIEELQEELKSSQGDVSSFMLLLEGLSKNDCNERVEDYSLSVYLPESCPYIDDLDDLKMQEMEEARQDYVAAVAAAKARQDEESIAAAAAARSRLQAFVFET